MAAPSPRHGVAMGDTSHQVSDAGLYFSTVLTVHRPRVRKYWLFMSFTSSLL